jgi:putative endopeptidase
MPRSATPKIGDNFYKHVNHTWLTTTKMPAKYPRWSNFHVLSEENDKQVKEIIIDCKKQYRINTKVKSNSDRIGVIYSLGMNEKRLAHQSSQIQELLDNLQSTVFMKSTQVVDHMATFLKYQLPTFLNAGSSPDSKDTSVNRLHLFESGLGLPEKKYYTEEDKHKDIVAGYKKYLADLLRLTSDKYLTHKIKVSTETYAEEIYKLEKSLAKNTLDNEQKRDVHLTYNKYKISEINSKLGLKTFDLAQLVKNIGLTTETVIVDHPEFYQHLDKVISNSSNEMIMKEYFMVRLMSSMASYLEPEFEQLRFNFYGKMLSGQKEMKPRWQRVVHTLNSQLGEVIGKQYVKKYFPSQSKVDVLKMVNQFKDELKEIITNAAWMTKSTKRKALVKLEKMRCKIGYPDKWRDYSKLNLKYDTYVDNMLRCNNFDFEYDINKIDEPVDRDEWHMLPQTINAYFAPNFNEIVFPAAILQAPFYDLSQSRVKNYASIGMVIGHEMTHSFDDQGREYDENGELNSWWTKTDTTRFEKERKKIVEQYNNFTVFTENVNGELTQGENIADVGGLKIALNSFINNNKHTDKDLVNFFECYAELWRLLSTKEMALQLVKIDPHSPAEYRVNGAVQNLPEFYEIMGIKESDPMCLPEKLRCKIW